MYFEVLTTLDLNNSWEDGGEGLHIPSLPSQSPAVAALCVTPPLDPAPHDSGTLGRYGSNYAQSDQRQAGGEMPEEMLQQLLMQDSEWGRHKDRSALFLFASVARLLRQMPGNHWEDYRDKCWKLIGSTRKRASNSFGANGAARRWLTAIGMELPAQARRPSIFD